MRRKGTKAPAGAKQEARGMASARRAPRSARGARKDHAKGRRSGRQPGTIHELLKHVIGKGTSLPADASENVDKYVVESIRNP
ncbi:MAG: hypothetical protein HY719_02570 [Planctomycetes bacterium]|nr:hypothetical protein [Planctomycetota bacterium]